jgi:hypothetical protein
MDGVRKEDKIGTKKDQKRHKKRRGMLREEGRKEEECKREEKRKECGKGKKMP